MATFAMPRFLGTPKRALKRYKQALGRKSLWVPHMRECYEYAIPHREGFFVTTPGQKKNTHLFDSTAIRGVKNFASKLQALLVPAWKEWTKLVPGSDIPKDEAEKPEVEVGLELATESIFTHINHSNFSSQVTEGFMDLAVGTMAMTCEESFGVDTVLEFNAVSMEELVLEEGPKGTIETVWREHKIAARNVARTWPNANPSVAVRKLAKASGKSDTDVVIVEGTVFDPDTGIYHHIAIEKKTEHLVFREDSEVTRWIVGRWFTGPGEIYGRGPVMDVLPDIKTANKVVEFILKNAALQISGMYTSRSDSALNPYTMRIAPGIVIPVESNETNNPTIRALERTGDMDLGFDVLVELRRNISHALLADKERPDTGPVRTATVEAIEDRDRVQEIGSNFGRLQTEIIEQTIKIVVHILQRRGKIPPIRVNGRQVTLKHTSPLARAQDQEELITLQQAMETLAPLGFETIALGVKVEDIPAWVIDKTGLDKRLKRPEADREVLKQLVADLVVQATEAQQAQAGGTNLQAVA